MPDPKSAANSSAAHSVVALNARNRAKRSVRRVALLAMYPVADPAMPDRISNHGLRMVEDTLRAADISDLDLHVYDLHDASVDELVEELVQLDPDIVAFSTYLWSFPLFAKVA